MKAAIGLVLVFTGLTVGYLVLTGRLPASATVVNTLTPGSGPGQSGLPGGPAPGHGPSKPGGGGQMQASVPDSVARGQLIAVKPVRAGGY